MPVSSAIPPPRRSTLLELLTLEQIDRDLYRSTQVDDHPHLYGGQVAGQALLAAAATVPDDRLPHSIHSYFLRRGESDRPVVLHVDRDRDGRSYTARRVTAVQDGAVIFNMALSFHTQQEGEDLQLAQLPDVEPPEELPDSEMDHISFLRSFESRIPAHLGRVVDRPSRGWFRPSPALPADPNVHLAALLYLSDTFTGMWTLPFAQPDDAYTSLDHAMWFHRPFRFDDWVLLDLTGKSAAGGRGFYSGSVFARDGRLIASLTQECLARLPAAAVPSAR